jgi:hypothetical protein
MLTLAGSLRVDRFAVYRDIVRRAEAWVTTSTFYVVPDAPAIARDANGAPLFDFLWYRTPPDAASAGLPSAGGFLTVTVSLAPRADEIEILREHLEPIARNEGSRDTIAIRSLPVTTGTVSLAFAGETGGADFARAVAGNGPVSLSGAERATFVVELTRDGAALLWSALEGGRDLLHARYDLVFQHWLGDIEMRVWCEAQQAHRATAARLAAGTTDPRGLREGLQAQHLAGVDIRSETPLDPAHQAALEKVGAMVLEAALADALFSFEQPAFGPGLARDGRVGALRPFQTSMTATLNMTFRESYPVEAHAILQDVLTVGRTAAELGDRVTQVDLRGERRIIRDVSFLCTTDFAHDLIDLVKVRLTYEGTTAAGPIHHDRELVFKEGIDAGRVRFDLASPDQRAYRYQAEVYYDGSPVPTVLAFGPVEDSIVVLDVDALGVLTVEAVTGDVSFEHVRTILVELEHPASTQTARLAIDREHPSGTWRVIIRDWSREYRRRTTWIAADGRRIEENWQASTASRIRLNMPPTLGVNAARSVQLVAAGDYSAVRQIIAEVRLSSAPGAPHAEFAFSAPGQTASWDLAFDPVAHLRYQVRRIIVRPDGTRLEGGWEDTDDSVLLVRDDARHQVEIVTRLLRFSPDVPLMLLALEPVDGVEDDRATLQLRDGAGTRWSFAVPDPTRHRYRYQLTLIHRDGRRAPQPWEVADQDLLVLRPPA